MEFIFQSVKPRKIIYLSHKTITLVFFSVWANICQKNNLFYFKIYYYLCKVINETKPYYIKKNYTNVLH